MLILFRKPTNLNKSVNCIFYGMPGVLVERGWRGDEVKDDLEKEEDDESKHSLPSNSLQRRDIETYKFKHTYDTTTHWQFSF